MLVINLFNKVNDANLRYLEFINKRTLQFKGIFGLSDMTLGNFYDEIDIDEVLSKLRPSDKIQASFKQNLLDNEQKNKEIVADSTDTLFTTFTKEVAEKITITPQYIIDEMERIDGELWEVVKWFFGDYNKTYNDCFFEIDEQQQTITPQGYEKLSLLFYYNTGSKNKPYQSLKGYGMSKNLNLTKQKSKLEYVQGDIKVKIGNLNKELETVSDRINKAKIKRQISPLQKELRQRQEGLYRDSAKLDDELKQKIDELTSRQNWAVTVIRHFVLQVNTEN